MKNFITEESISIEGKNENRLDVKNLLNFAILTNNLYSLHLEQSDRRYLCLNISDKYLRNEEYFTKLRLDCFNQNAANHFYTYICSLTSTVNLRDIPMTDLKKEIIDHSKPNPVRFLEYVLEVRENRKENQGNILLTDDPVPATMF